MCFCFLIGLLQGLLSVTEELHSLSFEACFTVQGLTIDLEVSSTDNTLQISVSKIHALNPNVCVFRLLHCHWLSFLMCASCLGAVPPSCGITF